MQGIPSERFAAGGETLRSRRQAWAVVLASFALYAVLFGPVGGAIGPAYVPLGIVPIVLAAWLFGRTGGVAGAIAMLATGDVLALMFGTIELSYLTGITHATRFGAGLLVGFTVGWVRDLQGRLAVEKIHLVAEVESRRAKETELRRAQRRLDEAEEIGRLGSWEVDLAKGRIEWSPSLQHLLEAPLPQADLDAALSHVHPHDREPLVEAVRTRLQGKLPFDEECRIVLAGGREARLRVRGQPFFDEDGRMIRLVGLAQDVTAIHAAEAERRIAQQQREDIERLAQLNQFKGQFISAAAHELNTPMTPIILQLELLKNPTLGRLTDAQEKSLGILERNLRRLNALMKDLLDAARLQSSGLRMLYEPTRVADMLQESVESFEPAIRKAGLRIEADIDDPGTLLVDGRRLSQVVYNFLSNATKFGPSGSTIRVRAKVEGRDYVVRVSDTGPGLTADQIARLFQPFVQLHDSGGHPPGTGLGLYISKGIVEQHAGRIWASSAGLGAGAEFGFAIPLSGPVRPREVSLAPLREA